MKYILVAVLSCIGMAAQANEYCAGNVSEMNKIQDISAQIDIFGTWKGVHNGENFVAVFSKTPNGNFSGKLTLGTKTIGPTGVQVCDYGNEYALVVYWQQAPLKILSSKKVEITLPFDGNPKVVVTKQQ